MYVFYPAEELFRIYESRKNSQVNAASDQRWRISDSREKTRKAPRRGQRGLSKRAKQASMQHSKSIDEGSNPLKDLVHSNLNEPLKQHNGNVVKLVQTGEFEGDILNVLTEITDNCFSQSSN